MTKQHIGVEIKPGKILRYYSNEEISNLVAKWLDVFGKDKQGVNAKAYLWHIFSGGRYPSVSGSDALNQYRQQSAPEYIVLSNDRKLAFATDFLPEECSLSDYYVFTPNLAWTMAFTHEDGWLGPYFARHENFEALDVDNRNGLRKAREAEIARLKGWR